MARNLGVYGEDNLRLQHTLEEAKAEMDAAAKTARERASGKAGWTTNRFDRDRGPGGSGKSPVVGSEEARLRAGLRPPPKPCMQFSRTRLSRRHETPRCNEKATNKWAIRFTRPVGSGLQYPRTMMYGFFAKRTDPPHHPYSADYPSLPSCLRLPPSP